MGRTTTIRWRGMLAFIATYLVIVSGANAQVPITYPDIALVKRDYSGNIQTTDRDWFYLDEEGDPLTNGGGEHPSLEFDISENRRPGPNVTGVAYIKGTSTISVVVTIYGELSEGVDCSFTMQGARLAVPAPNQSEDDWEYITLTPSPTTAANWHWDAGNRTKTISFTFTTLPNHVALGRLEVKYSFAIEGDESMILCNNGTNNSFVPWEWQYVVFSTPDGLQEVPWTDFLNYTCRWAYGADDAAETAKELTRGMHYSNRSKDNRVEYNMGGASSYYPISSESENLEFKLTDFTTNLDSELWTTMDCRDFAGALWLGFQSQGLSPRFDIVQRTNSGMFWTWPLCPAGTDSTDSGNGSTDLGNYLSVDFGYHCVITYGSARFESSSSYLWQPTSAVWKNPPWEWGIADHWQKEVSSKFYGLVYGTIEATHPFSSGSQLPHDVILDFDPETIV